jgi:hypothetical protein
MRCASDESDDRATTPPITRDTADRTEEWLIIRLHTSCRVGRAVAFRSLDLAVAVSQSPRRYVRRHLVIRGLLR